MGWGSGDIKSGKSLKLQFGPHCCSPGVPVLYVRIRSEEYAPFVGYRLEAKKGRKDGWPALIIIYE